MSRLFGGKRSAVIPVDALTPMAGQDPEFTDVVPRRRTSSKSSKSSTDEQMEPKMTMSDSFKAGRKAKSGKAVAQRMRGIDEASARLLSRRAGAASSAAAVAMAPGGAAGEASLATQASELPASFPRCMDWPELDGEWRACSPSRKLKAWLHTLSIKDGLAIDGDGDATVLERGPNGPMLRGGVLRRQGDLILRTGRGGSVQLFVPRRRT